VTVDLSDARSLAVTRSVVELERHVATGGWDAPIRLFALVRTAAALAVDPDLHQRLPADVVAAAEADPEHLTAVEQEGLPESETLQDLLGRIAWPDTVDGAAVVVERVVVPPEVEAQLPADEHAALEFLQAHPARRDVRLAAAALRTGEHACALRSREHDEDSSVAVGPDLAPGLVEAVASTLR
jgi:hypothetical protein